MFDILIKLFNRVFFLKKQGYRNYIRRIEHIKGSSF